MRISEKKTTQLLWCLYACSMTLFHTINNARANVFVTFYCVCLLFECLTPLLECRCMLCVLLFSCLFLLLFRFVSDDLLTNTNWFEEYDRCGVSVRFICYECVVLFALLIWVNVIYMSRRKFHGKWIWSVDHPLYPLWTRSNFYCKNYCFRICMCTAHWYSQYFYMKLSYFRTNHEPNRT